MVLPTVSVIIPTYNRRDYVQEAIDSVLVQTYTDYEIIVIDDGSTDDTGEALQARYGDRIHYEWQENQGESVARNRGVDLARGEYIAFLDSDDLWLPEKLEKQVTYLDARPEIRMVFSASKRIDAEGKGTKDPILQDSHSISRPLTLEEVCLRTYPLAPSTLLMAGTVFRASEGFDSSIRYAEDYDLWLRLRFLSEMHYMEEPLVLKRRHREAQCYIPSPERNHLRLEAYLSALDKVLSEEAGIASDFKRRIDAWQYAEVALLQAAAGDYEASKICLEKVCELDPGLLERFEPFGEAIVRQVILHFEFVQEGDLLSSLTLLDFLLASLREMGRLKASFARKVRAKSFESIGFAAFESGNRKIARSCFLRAIIRDPVIARNTGLLSLLFESLFGQRISDLRKIVWRSLRLS